jgi:hypothetical protein
MDVAIVGNADTIWGEHAIDGLLDALDEGLDLVGPVSNRPGWGTPKQVASLMGLQDRWIRLGDSQLEFDHSTRSGVGMSLRECINGFTMAARMDTWAAGAFDIENGEFFNPKYKQTENEMELQLRWALLDWRIGIALNAYVHHFKGEFNSEDLHYRDSRIPRVTPS